MTDPLANGKIWDEIKRPGDEWIPDDGGAWPVGTLVRPLNPSPTTRWRTLRVTEPVKGSDGTLWMTFEFADKP